MRLPLLADKERGNEVIERLLKWAEARQDIRAVLLTSTRANPQIALDAFSDYDIILLVREIRPFLEDESWLEEYGEVLTVYRDPVQRDYGLEKFAHITQYADGTKIDYTVYPVEIMTHILHEPKLPDTLDVGYAVLLDKDGLTKELKPATYTAFIPSPPAEAEYREVIETFYSESTYVAKNLRRDELIMMKYNLDYVMKFELLRKMLEWRMEIDHGWSLKTGAYGKGLKKHISPKVWAKLENTYVGPGEEENWAALFRTIDLFRQVAVEVGDRLGYDFPHDLDRRVKGYLHRVKDMDRSAGPPGKAADKRSSDGV
jgi:aminoglycoside 6-adenylyltransferase